MKNPKAKALLDKYKMGETSEEENAFLETWYLEEGQLSADPVEKEDEVLAAQSNVWNKIQQELIPVAAKKTRLLPWISGVAAAVTLIVCGIYFFTARYVNKDTSANIAHRNDISPGKFGATLTLGSGKKIRLSDASSGQLANESGVSITKSKDGRLVYNINDVSEQNGRHNTLTTAKGESYQVRLPDGTEVWLNAASSLTYSATLNEHGERRVKLEGEAFFHVAKDKRHPFVVTSGAQEVKVLGTQFNINTYTEEASIKTTLLEGSVSVNNKVMLKPGEQSVLKGKMIDIVKADMHAELGWKNDDFIFKDEDVQSVMRKLSRWYDIEVVYEGDLPDDKFDGEVSRRRNLSEVLAVLQQTNSIHFKIEGRKIIVNK